MLSIPALLWKGYLLGILMIFSSMKDFASCFHTLSKEIREEERCENSVSYSGSPRYQVRTIKNASNGPTF